jgi:hypothetical protein
MAEITREQLHAFLDDALDDAEATKVEKGAARFSRVAKAIALRARRARSW